MDREAFLLACREATVRNAQRQGIGTLGEKTMHAALKRYFDPCTEHHECRTGPYVADVRGEEGIVEIQTRGFFRLRSKLEYFLELGPVTVAYPVPAVKWVSWIEEDGSVSPRRRSPKRPTACAVLPELYGIRQLLGREGLRFCVLLLEAEDYRLKNGWSRDGKRGSARFERMPIDLLDEIWLEKKEDFRRLVPAELPEEFTAKEFGKASGLSARNVSGALCVLRETEAVELIGKKGRAHLYRRKAEVPRTG